MPERPAEQALRAGAEWCTCLCRCGATRQPAVTTYRGIRLPAAYEATRNIVRFAHPWQLKEWSNGGWRRWAE